MPALAAPPYWRLLLLSTIQPSPASSSSTANSTGNYAPTNATAAMLPLERGLLDSFAIATVFWGEFSVLLDLVVGMWGFRWRLLLARVEVPEARTETIAME